MKTLISYLIRGNDKHIERNSTVWNVVFCGLNSLQSAIMMLTVVRICGVELGGIFSIGYATGQLMYTVGSYSFRNYHATDIGYAYSFSDYSWARALTCALMALVSILYCVLRQYDVFKACVVLLACLLKLLEAVEDLYHGELQRFGRLDIAGRAGTLRVLLNDAVFLLVMLASRDVTAALIGVVLVTGLMTVVTWRSCIAVSQQLFVAVRWEHVGRLLLVCLPLFVSGCLSLYISDASRYAIDAHLDDAAQTYFSVIFMPIYTINILSMAVFRPKMKKLAERWNCGDLFEFRRIVLGQVGIIAALTATIMAFGLWLGLPILSWLYKLSLDQYVGEFAILLVGGGVVSVYNWMSACVTVMRKQASLLVLSGVAGVTALVASNLFVLWGGMIGACWSYLLLMLLEAVGGAALTWVFYRRRKERRGEETP